MIGRKVGTNSILIPIPILIEVDWNHSNFMRERESDENTQSSISGCHINSSHADAE